MFIDIEDSKFCFFYIKSGISFSKLLFDLIDNMDGCFLDFGFVRSDCFLCFEMVTIEIKKF